MHRSQRKYSQKNVMLALTKLKLLGVEEPIVMGYYTKDDGDKIFFGRIPFSKASPEAQATNWVKVLNAVREATAKQRGEEHKRRNGEQ